MFRTTNPDEARAHLTEIFLPHHLLADKSIAFSHRQFNFPTISLNLLRYGGEVQVVSPPLGDFYLLQLTVCGDCTIMTGDEPFNLTVGDLFVMNATRNVRKIWSSTCQQLTVKINRQALEQELAEALQNPLHSPLEFCNRGTKTGLDSSAAALAALMRTCCATADCGSPAVSLRSMRATERALLGLLLDAVPHNYSDELMQASAPAAPYYVRRAEAFMRSHALEQITLDDMAAASGVSIRSLHYGFRRFRNSTPLAVLKAIRLKQARRMLETTGCRVTDAALACGFRHLGKFSRDFRRQFGVVPSDIGR